MYVFAGFPRSWKTREVMEFHYQIFQAWKIMESVKIIESLGKVMEFNFVL